jgi:hypothetical protein
MQRRPRRKLTPRQRRLRRQRARKLKIKIAVVAAAASFASKPEGSPTNATRADRASSQLEKAFITSYSLSLCMNFLKFEWSKPKGP